MRFCVAFRRPSFRRGGATPYAACAAAACCLRWLAFACRLCTLLNARPAKYALRSCSTRFSSSRGFVLACVPLSSRLLDLSRLDTERMRDLSHRRCLYPRTVLKVPDRLTRYASSRCQRLNGQPSLCAPLAQRLHLNLTHYWHYCHLSDVQTMDPLQE